MSSSGETFEVTFTQAGTFPYYCDPHRTFGMTGYTNTCATACAASTQAVGEAVEVIRRGAADVVAAGGTEAGICEIGMGGFSTILTSLLARGSHHDNSLGWV